jgi:hypothetical protein
MMVQSRGKKMLDLSLTPTFSFSLPEGSKTSLWREGPTILIKLDLKSDKKSTLTSKYQAGRHK